MTGSGADTVAPAGAPDDAISDKPGGHGSSRIAVPDLVGQDVGSAHAALTAAGLVFLVEAKSGDRTAITNSWEVCQTIPKAGARAPKDSSVTVISAAPGGC